jgi:hypothetical protein
MYFLCQTDTLVTVPTTFTTNTKHEGMASNFVELKFSALKKGTPADTQC